MAMTAPLELEPLVSTDWLESHLHDPNVRVLDIRGSVSTRVVTPGVEEATYRGAPQEFRAGHIPGAQFVDWTQDIVDLDDPVPAQLSSPERFTEAMQERGIDKDTRVIAVDHMGGQFATRLWWALKAYGHDAVAVLDGGWNRWVEEGRPIESDLVEPARGDFQAEAQPGWRATAEDVMKTIGVPDVQIVDARDQAQYHGKKRRGPRGGHVPGALHLPRELFFAETGGFLPIEEVRRRVEAAGLELEKATLAYCNGGVAATVVLFNLFRLGQRSLTNYDGSWNEWGARSDLPTESS
jgi:thiosulfate/3-mercaptopyruvate sulfurtransferase